MSGGLTTETIILIVVFSTIIAIFIIWLLYKIISYFREANDEALVDGAAQSSESEMPKTLKNGRRSDSRRTSLVPIKLAENTIGAKILNVNRSSNNHSHKQNRSQKELPANQQQKEDSESYGLIPQIRKTIARKKYIEYKSELDSQSSDLILQQELVANSPGRLAGKSSTSAKSTLQHIGKSTGFEPSIKPVEPVVKGHRSTNFLEILDKLNQLDADEEEERKERERRRRRREERARSTSSAAEIEANSSDETASQTFIGKEPDARPEPGRIKLGLITLDYDAETGSSNSSGTVSDF